MTSINERVLTIGRLCQSTGVKLETIRYYERIKLMPSPRRTKSGHRAYEETDSHRLKFIRRARELGFGIGDIRALLTLAEPQNVSCADVRKIASAHLEIIRAKLNYLVKLEHILSEVVNSCSDEATAACPVIDMLNAAR